MKKVSVTGSATYEESLNLARLSLWCYPVHKDGYMFYVAADKKDKRKFAVAKVKEADGEHGDREQVAGGFGSWNDAMYGLADEVGTWGPGPWSSKLEAEKVGEG